MDLSRRLLLLIFLLFATLSLPQRVTDPLRGVVVAGIVPARNLGAWFRGKSYQRTARIQQECDRLELENSQLRDEIDHLKEVVRQELTLLQLAERLEEKEQGGRSDEWVDLLGRQLEARPARVVYRSPASWGSSFWINVGERDNRRAGHTLVAKESPVVVGSAIVGIVDQVSHAQSRVRLITDAGLHPSVRVQRGGLQDVRLAEQIEALERALFQRDDLLPPNEANQLLNQLTQLKFQLEAHADLRLAKGELSGSSQPLWRCQGNLLRGTGFNYDFPDDEGPARDLRTGVPAGSLDQSQSLPILKPGDLLITTGMDGVFPPGLEVAWVEAIDPLAEGAYAYALTARPAAGNLADSPCQFLY